MILWKTKSLFPVGEGLVADSWCVEFWWLASRSIMKLWLNKSKQQFVLKLINLVKI
jgi:hypothetical protein